MKVSSEAIGALGGIRAVNLESDLIRLLAERFALPLDEAMRLYYESGFSETLANNEHGEQYLDSTYLFDELLRHLDLQGR